MKNITNKVKYMDSIQKWASVIILMARSDTKYQERLNSIGFMIYLEVEYDAKETRRQAETDGLLLLEG